MKVDDIFRRYVTTTVLAGVSLVDLVTNLMRMDLRVVNEEDFLHFTLEAPPFTANQPAL